MPWRRPRLTIRGLMVAVAIVGVLFCIEIEGERRRQRFRVEANRHWDLWLNHLPAKLNGRGGDVLYGERTAFHLEMWKKYDQATWYPWLPVAPDPPEPE